MPFRISRNYCSTHPARSSTWSICGKGCVTIASPANVSFTGIPRQRALSPYRATKRASGVDHHKRSHVLQPSTFATASFSHGSHFRKSLEATNDDATPKKEPSSQQRTPSFSANRRLYPYRGTSFSDHLIEYMTLNGYDVPDKAKALEAVPKDSPIVTATTASKTQSFVSDGFCARVFATKAFHPSFVMQTLSTFGVKTIGPLALQALVQRCLAIVDEEYLAPPNARLDIFAKEVGYHIDQAKHFNLSISTTDYTLLVQKLAKSSNGILLELVLTSDHHPDVYGDPDLQQQFLISYLRQERVLHVDKTLHVLTLHSRHPTIAAWNLLLRAHMYLPSSQRWLKLSETLDHIISHDIPVTAATLDESFRTLPRPRAPSTRPISLPSSVEFDDLLFITNMWIRILTHQPQAPLHPRYWREIIKRFGMIGRVASLHSLIRWLLRTYSPSSPSVKSTQHSAYILNDIFRPKTQKAIIEWFFISLSNPVKQPTNEIRLPNDLEASVEWQKPDSNIDNIDKWAHGVALMHQLKDHGVKVSTLDVQRACLRRLIILFGQDRVSSSIRNRYARKHNVFSLPYMVRYLQQIWEPEVLFPISNSLLSPHAKEDHVRLQRAIEDLWLETRRTDKRSSLKHPRWRSWDITQ